MCWGRRWGVRGWEGRSVGTPARWVSAAAPLRRHVSSLLSFTASVTTRGGRVHGARPRLPSPRLFVILNGAVHRGHWSASRRACLRHMGERQPRRLQYPECPAGSIEYHITTHREEEEVRGWAPSCLWDWFNWDTGSPVFVACRT